jgi:hypothetical protein
MLRAVVLACLVACFAHAAVKLPTLLADHITTGGLRKVTCEADCRSALQPTLVTVAG